jgi:GDPmannose 4,6-dehydratase
VRRDRSRALIVGATGQDGLLLARFLSKKGYEVVGTSRNPSVVRSEFHNLGVDASIKLVSMLPSDFRSVFSVIQAFLPDEVYNLAGQTSVSLSFDQPVETMESISHSNLIMLEVIRLVSSRIRYYNAVSSEIFGDVKGRRFASEASPINPRSPYGVAKASSYWLVRNYREAYGLHLSNGILSNHESINRPATFVVPKIVSTAVQISKSQARTLCLGNLEIQRDWGWAEDYVEAMWLMLQKPDPGDYVIGTGRTVSLKYILRRAFENFDLDWQNFVVCESSELRPTDLQRSALDASKARRELGWSASHDVDWVVDRLSEHFLQASSRHLGVSVSHLRNQIIAHHR